MLDQVNNQTRPLLGTSDTTTLASDHSDAQPMDTDIYGPPLPPKFTQSVQSHAFKHSDLESNQHSDPHSEDQSEQPKRVCSKAKKHSDKKKRKVQAKYYSQSSSSEENQSSVPIKKSTKPQQKAPSGPEHQQDNTDLVFSLLAISLLAISCKLLAWVGVIVNNFSSLFSSETTALIFFKIWYRASLVRGLSCFLIAC